MSETMWALTYDRTREDWQTSRGMVRERVPVPVLDPTDTESVIVRVHYAGFCGSDRGIWARKSFGDLVASSLDHDRADRRIFGHEFFGIVTAVGSEVTARYDIRVGDTVSAESHITCGVCESCIEGMHHVCRDERILGISTDGVFCEYAKIPAKVLWKTDLSVIRPEVAAVQEPFGNAVHAVSSVDVQGRTVAIFGTGTIGLFAALIARSLGAKRVIGIEPDAHNQARAHNLGVDPVLSPAKPSADKPWAADQGTVARLHELTHGLGVDVAFEMSGVPSSTNTAIQSVRPGGHVVLFGVRNGDLTIENMHRVIMRGLQFHGIVGRHIWGTWEITRKLLSDPSLGVQDAVWHHILDDGQGTIFDIKNWDPAAFEATFQTHPKMLIRFD